MKHIEPVKKVKSNAKGAYYEAKVSCGVIKILIVDGEDGSPGRVTAQYSGGGCEGNMEAIQRLVTLLFECNIKPECLYDQLDKVVCNACKVKFKDDKTISLSCSKAISSALKQHTGFKGE